ncbi:transferase family [Fusarium napiforme]|uniref:Transferase family n=1 Tax=Fusarium napiforme TaxID=42672 RepID=A0A8H5MMM2_9HYPO|nr:transferase family [Fusarium napiforme]
MDTHSQASHISEGFDDITAREFADAVNKAAWWLEGLVGNRESFQTIGYIGPHDIRYLLLNLACAKVGYQVIFLSPGNSIEAALGLLEATKCALWVHRVDYPLYPLVARIQQTRELRILEIPTVTELLHASSSANYPYTKTYDEAMGDPFCILHTSGTTGLPKPIYLSNGLLATMDAARILPPFEGDNGARSWATLYEKGDRLYSPCVLLHGPGIFMNLFATFLFDTHSVMGPVGVHSDMNLLASLADHGNIDIWHFMPVYVNELGQHPEVLEKFRPSKFIGAGGGPVSAELAAKVNEVVRVHNLFGTTEGLFMGDMLVDKEDFPWVSFHPYAGFEYTEIEKGLFEQRAVKNEHWALHQGIFHTFPYVDEFNFKDLFVKHPRKPNLWLYMGRSNGIICLEDAQKLSPIETENMICAHPSVKGCVMIGNGQKFACLMVELREDLLRDPEIIEVLTESLGDIIDQADRNQLLRGYLRRDYIILADPKRPLPRTEKGTISRRAALKLYEEEIDMFYRLKGEATVGVGQRTAESA